MTVNGATEWQISSLEKLPFSTKWGCVTQPYSMWSEQNHSNLASEKIKKRASKNTFTNRKASGSDGITRERHRDCTDTGPL